MRLTIAISTIIFAAQVFGQGIVNKGASIVVKDDAHMVITTANGHYLNKLNGLLYGKNGGFVHVRGNWVNNGTSPAIGNNDGTVILDGGAQRIGGTRTTNFNSLTLQGSGDKWIDLSTLVGGGYAGTKSGTLDLGAKNLMMPGKKLTVNNPQSTAITTSTGLLVGETSPVVGYSILEWNIRDATSGNAFIVPFGSNDLIPIPLTYIVSSVGTQVSDSGRLSFVTYPTNPAMGPNNRPLPNGVFNLENQYKIENDIKTLDRFYIIGSQGYSNQPTGALEFAYIDREWDATGGSINQILESDLIPARYSFASNSWDFTFNGSTNTAGNFTAGDQVSDPRGVWVLHNKPPCPVAFFKSSDDCIDLGIYAYDSSRISSGLIDSNVWVTSLAETINRDTIHSFFPIYGNYNIKRKVRGDRGCWDSISKTVRVFPKPKATFIYRDTCKNDLTTFASTSSSPTGNPVTNSWLIDGSLYATNSAFHTFADTGLQPIRLISRNNWGCLDTAIHSLEIQPPPNVNFTFTDICEGELISFVNATTTKGTLVGQRWSVDDKLASFANDYQQVFNRNGGYNIKLSASNGFGCVDSITIPIVVKARAIANFSIFPDEIFIHEPYVNLVERSAAANTWEWELGDFSPTEYTPTVFHTYADTGVFSIRLIAGNDQNCPDTIFKVIRIKPYLKIYIPNAFSPGDPTNENNTFGPAGMLYGLKEMTMEIYNRWGEQLYFSDNINNPWDGTFMGKPVKEGTYLYMIKMKDIYNQIAWHQGTVTVVR